MLPLDRQHTLESATETTMTASIDCSCPCHTAATGKCGLSSSSRSTATTPTCRGTFLARLCHRIGKRRHGHSCCKFADELAREEERQLAEEIRLCKDYVKNLEHSYKPSRRPSPTVTCSAFDDVDMDADFSRGSRYSHSKGCFVQSLGSREAQEETHSLPEDNELCFKQHDSCQRTTERVVHRRSASVY